MKKMQRKKALETFSSPKQRPVAKESIPPTLDLTSVKTTYLKKGPFYGVGLGLDISSQIIHHHKGKIWVDSVQGKGSTFSFSLPIYRS
jgi:sensor histidine kinase regulating citrate/malate metabolism